MENPALIEKICSMAQANTPVSMVDIAKELNVKIYHTSGLKDGESGLIRKEGDAYVIYINKNHPMTRQRFTMAHEIAHFLLHKDKLDAGKEIIENAKREVALYRSDSSDQDRQMEAEADKLAAELLMPSEKFCEIWDKSGTLEDVADTFHVSTAAASMRAKHLLGYSAI